MISASFLSSVALSSFVLIINTPILFFVLTKFRKQKEIVILSFVLVADLSNAIAAIMQNLQILLVQNEIGLSAKTNYDCLHIPASSAFIFAYQFINASTIAVTLDRALAVLMPFRYRQFTYRYSYCNVGGALACSMIGSGLCFIAWINGPELVANPICTTDSAYNPMVWSYLLYCRQFSILLSIVAYIPIADRVHYLRKNDNSLRAMNGAPSQTHRRLVRTTILIGVTLLCETLLIGLPDLILNHDLFGLAGLKDVWYTIINFKGVANIFIYTFSHEEIKRALVNCILCYLPCFRRIRLRDSRDVSIAPTPSIYNMTSRAQTTSLAPRSSFLFAA